MLPLCSVKFRYMFDTFTNLPEPEILRYLQACASCLNWGGEARRIKAGGGREAEVIQGREAVPRILNIGRTEEY